jgi:hypothetical protein
MYDYRSCDIAPWLAEIVSRMHEAAAQQTNVVNLSYTHPRGFIPNQIIRRPAVQKTLAGWMVWSDRYPADVYPDHVFMPRSVKKGTLDFCPTEIFEKEMALREHEALQTARQTPHPADLKVCPLIDLTNFHPRGGVPAAILARLERRKSRTWMEEARAQVQKLQSEANKAEAFAQTQKERAEGLQSKGGDPAPLLAAAQRELEKAETARAQAKLIRTEMGEAA